MVDQAQKIIPNGWRETTLGNVAEFCYGKMPDKFRVKLDEKYPIFSGYQITGYYDEYNSDEDLIVVARGVGGTGDVKISPKKSYVTNLSIIIKLDQSISDKVYFYYKFALNNLRYLDSGSAQSQIVISDLKNIQLLLPTLSEQRAIAAVLSSFDEKIELLRAQNKTLENIAQALFKCWFIDFGFPDKDGKPYRPNGGKMINSGLGEIPEGWRLGKYSDLVSVVTGKGINKENLHSSGLYQILGANGEIGKTNEYLFDEDLILTGRVGTLGTIYFSKGKVWISDNVLISKPVVKENYYFAYYQLKKMNFESLNRGSTQPLITQTDLKNVEVVIPNNKLLNAWHIVASSLFNKIFGNSSQIQTLSKMRDAILPKLMRGEVRVKGFNN